MLHVVEEQLKELLEKAGVTGEIEFSKPPKTEMGDVAFACFDFAKIEGRNPVEVAKDLADKVTSYKLQVISNIKAFGPYVNFFFNTCELANLVFDEVNKKDFGQSEIGKGSQWRKVGYLVIIEIEQFKISQGSEG